MPLSTLPYNPYLIILALALPSAFIYWARCMYKGKPASAQDIAFFAGTISGFVTAGWLVVCCWNSIRDKKSYFSESQFTLTALLAMAFALVTVNKFYNMWKATNTPNVDDKK